MPFLPCWWVKGNRKSSQTGYENTHLSHPSSRCQAQTHASPTWNATRVPDTTVLPALVPWPLAQEPLPSLQRMGNPLALSLVSLQSEKRTDRPSFRRSLLMGGLVLSRSGPDLNQKPKTRNNKSPRNSPGHRSQVMCQVRCQEGHQPLRHLTLAWLHSVRQGANQDEVRGKGQKP